MPPGIEVQAQSWTTRAEPAPNSSSARQAANPWVVSEHLWGVPRDRLPHDPTLSFVDSVPVPVCRFGWGHERPVAHGCRRFRGEAAFGRDTGSKATYYGFRDHPRVHWPEVVSAFSVAAANVHDLALAPELVADGTGAVIGDRNSWAPTLTASLAPAGIAWRAPFKKRASDPDPVGSTLLTRLRWRIETVASQFVARYHLKWIWARDAWHLANWKLCKVLSHTIGVFLYLERGHSPLQFAHLLV